MLEENTLHLDEVEWITFADEERMKELGLSKEKNDMLDGYHIYNPSSEKVSFEITDEIIYNYITFQNLFIKEGEYRKYSTKKKKNLSKI